VIKITKFLWTAEERGLKELDLLDPLYCGGCRWFLSSESKTLCLQYNRTCRQDPQEHSSSKPSSSANATPMPRLSSRLREANRPSLHRLKRAPLPCSSPKMQTTGSSRIAAALISSGLLLYTSRLLLYHQSATQSPAVEPVHSHDVPLSR
jgi:hypothetical protein